MNELNQSNLNERTEQEQCKGAKFIFTSKWEHEIGGFQHLFNRAKINVSDSIMLNCISVI